MKRNLSTLSTGTEEQTNNDSLLLDTMKEVTTWINCLNEEKSE